MLSKWFELKPEAINLRKSGTSLRVIEKTLGIPRSTLSGWFKDIKVNSKAEYRLTQDRLNHLQKARKLAVKWHNTQRELRIEDARNSALDLLKQLDLTDKLIQELALAMLYLGEGGKTKSGTIMGSSDPLILRFFIKMLVDKYQVDLDKIRCALHLRADQNPEKLREYWARELNLPLKNFTSPSIDLRSKGRSTYPNYNGVCVVSCGYIAIQRKLIFLSREFCEKISNNKNLGS